jgi:hypothetical protein
MAYNPEMEKLKELQLLTQSATQSPMQAPMAAPRMPVQAPEVPQAKPSFLQRVGQRFDQAATGGIIDPTTLTKDQRRMLRAQLLMNVGGALAQNRPVGEGFQQQYNMLNKRQEEQAAKAKAALTEQQEATRQQIFQASDWSTPEGAQKLVRDLASAGLYDDAMEVTKNVSQKFKDGYTVMSDPVYGTILVDPTGRLPSQQVKIPGATPIPRAAPAQSKPSKVQTTKVVDGVPYYKIDGRWSITPF